MSQNDDQLPSQFEQSTEWDDDLDHEDEDALDDDIDDQWDDLDDEDDDLDEDLLDDEDDEWEDDDEDWYEDEDEETTPRTIEPRLPDFRRRHADLRNQRPAPV